MTIQDNIDAVKTTLLQMFEQSLSRDDKVTIKVEHKPVKDFQSFHGNYLITPPEHFIRIPLTMPLYSKIMYLMSMNKEWNDKYCSTALQGYCHGSWS